MVPMENPSPSSSLCSVAKEWLIPTLKASTEASVILRADDDMGRILYQNPSTDKLLHHVDNESSTSCMELWTFQTNNDETKGWADIASEIVDGSLSSTSSPNTSPASGCPIARYSSNIDEKANLPPHDDPEILSHQVSIRFQPIFSSKGCPCGCGAKYAIAYLTPTSSSLSSSAGITMDEQGKSSSYHRLQASMDASFDPMFTIDHTGIIRRTNQAAVTLFGYDSINDFIGHNVSMICGHDHASKHNQYLQEYLKTGITQIMGTQRRVLARRKDGSEFPVELGIVELPATPSSSSEGYFSAFLRDLSGQEKYQAQLLQQIQLTQGLINASFDPMIQIDQRGIIQVVNDAAVNLFGYTREELLESNIRIICGGEHAANHDGYLQRYLETGDKHVIGRKRPTQGRRKDGMEFPIELGIQEVELDNGEKAFCGFIRDLTSQTKMKESLQRQGQLIQAQFFGTQPASVSGSFDDEAASETGSTTSGGRRPRRPKRNHTHANTAPA